MDAPAKPKRPFIEAIRAMRRPSMEERSERSERSPGPLRSPRAEKLCQEETKVDFTLASAIADIADTVNRATGRHKPVLITGRRAT